MTDPISIFRPFWSITLSRRRYLFENNHPKPGIILHRRRDPIFPTFGDLYVQASFELFLARI